MFRMAAALMISVLPFHFLRILAYRWILSYSIAPKTKIGFGTVIAVDRAVLDGCSIGRFNRLTGPMSVNIGSGTQIHVRNTFWCGSWVHEMPRMAGLPRRLVLGRDMHVNSYLFFDVTGEIVVGDRTQLGGRGSQFWTHGPASTDFSVTIGEDCYIGSGALFAPGSRIGNNVIVGMGSVVTGIVEADNAMVAGNPARVVKENYDWKTRLPLSDLTAATMKTQGV